MSELITSLCNDLLLIDKDLVISTEKQTNLKKYLIEENYNILLSQIKNIPFTSYQAWIPNNGGFLSWTRIGVEYEVKKRYSFKANIFTKDKEFIPPIEVLDTDVDINDMVISNFAKDKSLKPIFVTSIKFQQKNSSGACEDIISGRGHLVENGIYKGESVLAFFPKKEYKKLLKKKIDEELKQIYSNLSYDDYNGCYNNLVSFFNKNKPCHAFKVNYEVEPKGRIKIESISILNNPDNDFTIESICSQEGYKQLVQLLYGQIKKVFHGDNHHNHKDDVILKVYESEASDITLPLKQMVEHMKGLEKIEKNRYKITCNEFIPSYVHEADGIIAYAEMYHENYITEENNDKKNGERFIKAAKAIHKSLKSIVDRNNDSYDLTVNYKKKSRNIATETATYILLLAFFAFILRNNTTIHPERSDIFSFLIFLIGCVVEINFLFSFFLVFIILLIFKNKFHFCLCKWFYLHKDLRPKDKYYARYLNKSSLYKYYQTFRFGFITLILIVLLLTLSKVAN